MQADELRSFIDKIPPFKDHFVGIYSIDTLPSDLKNRTFLIFNSALHNERGQHWICLCNINKKIEIFDSLGSSQEKVEAIKKFCKFKNKRQFKINDTPVQSLNSSSCGLFVLYFAINRFLNADLGFSALLNEIFTDNLDENEQLVDQFCKNF